MSLKAFHIIFVTCSTGLALFLASWFFWSYANNQSNTDLALGVISLFGGAGLIWYGKYFLKKLKNISYL